MAEEIRPVSVQKVAAILRKAGFSRPYKWSSGPVASRWMNDAVVVTHRRHSSEGMEVIPNRLTVYRAKLEEAGIVVESHESSLICTGIK